LVRVQKKIIGHVSPTVAKFVEHFDQPLGVLDADRHPNVDVRRRPRITVITHCVAADQKVLNPVGIQQLQEVFEVVR
jgi:hypothetical protein